ncbi:MAG: hypothetical protein ABR987_08415, partial [Terracidiphilus sp.]
MARLWFGPFPDRARQDAELLLLHLLRKNKAWLLAHGDEELPDDQADCYLALLERRKNGEPMQYIVGEQEFYGLPFSVTPDVLIPRPETEHLVEKALELARTLDCSVSGDDFSRAERSSKQIRALALAESKSGYPRILDVGTGSGAIA